MSQSKFSMRQLLSGSVFAASLLFGGAAQAQELVKGGAFTTDADLTANWTTVGSVIRDSDGANPLGASANLGSSAAVPVNSLSQNIATLPGRHYVLSFDYARRDDVTAKLKLTATIADAVVPINDQLVLPASAAISSRSYIFEATTTSTAITFSDVGTTEANGTTAGAAAADIEIDNISVRPANTVPGGISTGNGTPINPYTSLYMAYEGRASNPNTIKFFAINGQVFSSRVDADGYVLIASADLLEVNEASGYTQVNNMELQTDDILTSAIVMAMTPSELKMNSTSGTAINRATTSPLMLSRFSAYQVLSIPSVTGADTNGGLLWLGTGGLMGNSGSSASGSLDKNIWHASGINANLHWFPRIVGADGFAFTGGTADNDTAMNLWARDTTPGTESVVGLANWLKADADAKVQGGMPATNGTNVDTWGDQSGNGNDASQSSDGSRAALTAASMNFNPALTFNGSSDHLDIASDLGLVNQDDLTIFSVFTQPATVSGFSAILGGQSSVTGQPQFLTQGGGTNRSFYIDGLNVGSASSMATSNNGISASAPNIGVVERSASNTIDFFLEGKGFGQNTGFTHSFTAGNKRVGASGSANFFTGDIAETIVYNTALDATARQKVNSYLALKYGITLDQTAAIDYLSSSCTSVACSGAGEVIAWDASANAGYTNDIFGIGRDDKAGLDQRVSKSVNAGAILTVALDNNFAAANGDSVRSTAHTNDRQFFMLSNNGQAVTTQTNEVPSQFFERPSREWRVSKSANFGQQVDLKFDGFNGGWHLIKKSMNSNFSAGTTNLGRLNANGEILNVTLNDGDFLTLAADPSGPTVRITGEFLVTDEPFIVTFEFSETVQGFVSTDVIVTNGALSEFTVVDGNTYTAKITPAANGLVTIAVPDATSMDVNGNANTGDTQVVSAYSTEDRDNDGLSNVDDLDSDNDGVRDAIEGIGLSDRAGQCTATTVPDFTAANRSLASGVDKQVGAVYRYANALPAASGMPALDALVEITAINNAEVIAVEQEGALQASNFSPLVKTTRNSGGLVSGYVEWKITFIPTGASTSTAAVTLEQLGGAFIDLDSPAGAYESASIMNLPAAVAFQNGGFVSASRTTINSTDAIRFDHTDGFMVGAAGDPNGAAYFMYLNVSEFVFRSELGLSAAVATRNFNVSFNPCFLSDSLTNSKTTILSGVNSDASSANSDTIPDWLDLDSDGDGIPDNIESQTTLGYLTPAGDAGANNGLDSAYSAIGINPVDKDGDRRFDYRDTDADGDGMADVSESGATVSGVLGINGLVSSLELADDYSDVNGTFDITQADNFTDADSDVNSGGDVDYRDATLNPIDVSATGTLLSNTDGMAVADGASAETITLQLKDVSGGNLNYAGVAVSFSASAGSLSSTSVMTNAMGVATVTLTHTVAGSVMVSALVDQDQMAPTAAVAIGSVSDNGAVAAAGTAVPVLFTPGAAAKVVYSQQPSNAVSAANIAPAITVEIQDANGNVVTSATDTVTLAINANPSAGTLSGTASVAAVAGVATFTDLNIDKAGVAYTLDASSGMLTSATSSAFDIAAGAASQLVYISQPTNTGAAQAISTFQIAVQDAAGNTVAADNATTITLSFSNDPTGSATLGGTVTSTVVNGIATFNAVSVDAAGAGYQLKASAAPMLAVEPSSASFDVTTGAPTQLVYSAQPANTQGGATMSNVVVELQDAGGNVVTTATNNVTLAINANPSAGVLGGTLSVNAVSGIATFSDLNIDKVGSGYTLNATSGMLTLATSNLFDITFGVKSALKFTVQPVDTLAASSITPSMAVEIQDNNGNVVTSATDMVTIAINHNPGSGTLGGTATVAAVAGVATFSGISIDKVGTAYTLDATASGLALDTSSAFNIAVGAAADVVFTAQPTNTAGGAVMSDVTVSVVDAGGNVVPTATNSITLALTASGLPGVLTGTATVNAVAGVATFTGLSIDKAGAGYMMSATSGGFGDTSAAFNITTGTASRLAFTTQPSNIAGGATIAPAIVVEIQDAGGNVVTAANNMVSLAFNNNAGSGTLGNTLTVAAVAGVATFNDITVDKVGTAYTLDATATGLTTATSSSFDVTLGAAAKLVYSAQPTNTAGGNTIADIVVEIQDAGGNVVTGSTDAVTLAINNNAGSGALSGTVTLNAVAGIATFTGMSIDKAGTAYTLDATAAGLTTATSTAFDITLGAATKLGFVVQPTDITGGSTIAPAITVEIQDAGGNVISTATDMVTLAFNNNAGSGALGGTLTVAAASGVATFNDITVDKAGTGYTLDATATGLTTNTSNAFDVTLGAAAQVTFTAQPTNTDGGDTMANVIVEIQDAGGNLVSSTDNVTLAIANNAGPGGTLGGTLTVAAVGGVATFTGLNVDVAGAGYTLQATSAGLASETSTAFNIAVGPAAMMAFTTQPVTTTATQTMANVVVTIQDAGGNTVTSAIDNITLAMNNNAGSSTFSGTLTQAAVAGVATFSGLSLDKVGTGYTLDATSTALATVTSNAFNISEGAATQLVFIAQPTNSASLTNIAPPVAVAVQDAGGNTVTSDNATAITLAIGTNPSSGSLTGTFSSVSVVNGVASFSDLQIDAVGTGYTLVASSSPALTAATSSSFDIAAGGAAQLVFTAQPSNTAGGATMSGIVVEIRDTANNPVPTATNTVTLAINANPSSGTLSGAVSVVAVAGVATFNGLSVDKAGSAYTLDASATGLTVATSSTFDITVGAASQLAYSTQPTNANGGEAIADIVVQIQDAGGNVVTGATNNVTLAFANNAGSGTLSGAAAVAAVAGVATFTGISIDKAATAYTLGVTATGLNSATSAAFDISVGPASQLAITTQPMNTAGGATMASVVAQLQDAGGNVVTTATDMVTVAINNNAGSGTLSGTLTKAAVSGVVSFDNLSIDASGTAYTLDVTAAAIATATSNIFDITVGGATKLAFSVQPSNTAGGVAMSDIVVQVQDAGGNVISGSTNAITLVVNNNPSIGTLSGTLTVNAVNGVATFTGVNIDKAGNGYTLDATAAGLATATSAAFDISVGAASRLVITTQPTNTAAAQAINNIVVELQDAGGNVVTAATDAVTLAINNNPSTIAVLSGTATVNAVAGIATFTGLSIDKADTGYTLDATATGIATATSTAFDISVAAPAKLGFTMQPSNISGGASMADVKVEIQDAGGNLVAGATNSITLAITTATGTAGATLGSTLTVNAVGGVATFTGLSVDKAGTGYTLDATATGLTAETSTAFDVAVGVATKIVVTTQPVNTAGGASLNIVAEIQDAGGNVVTAATNMLTATINTNPSSGALSGTTAVSAAAGVATFNAMSIDAAGAGYALDISGAGLTTAVTVPFNISVGAATQLGFNVQPSNITAGAAIAPAVTVEIKDVGGNVVTSDSSTVVTMAFNNNAGSGTLSGTLTGTAVNGVATFSTLSVDKVGTGYTLDATATGLTTDISSAFNVTTGAATQLDFNVQPSNITGGAAVAPAVTVEIKDVGGNVVTSDSSTVVTVAFNNNAGSGTLSGTLTGTAVNGVATFSTLSVDKVGTGYTLDATATGLTTDTSSAFNVTTGAATQLDFNVQPSNITGGAAVAPAVTVEIKDAGGNVVTSDNSTVVTVAFNNNAGSGTLSGTLTGTAVNGVATFSTLSVDKVGTGYTLDATATGLTTDTSSAFNVTTGVASQVVFTTQPVNTSTAVAIADMTVAIQDAGGNVVDDDTTVVTLAIQNNAGTPAGTLTGGPSATATNGIVTFSGFSIDNAGAGYTLAATSSLPTVISAAFAIVDTNPPLAITINPIDSDDTNISGTAEPGTTISLMGAGAIACANNPVIAAIDGSWSCDLSGAGSGVQAAGTVITGTAADTGGNTSPATTTTVTNAAVTTVSQPPVINAVDSNDVAITGSGVPGATISLGNAPVCDNAPVVVAANGTWSCDLAMAGAQLVGATLSVTAAEPGKMVSPVVSTIVADANNTTAAPAVSPTDGDPIAGNCSVANAIVKVFDDTPAEICMTTAMANGSYSCSNAATMALSHGAKLSVTCTNPTTGQASPPTLVTVDKNAPAAPSINPVDSNDTAVTGVAEPGAIIAVSSSNATALVCNPSPVVADAAGNWTCTVAAGSVLASGDTITATASDAAGNTSANTVATVADAANASASQAPVINQIDDNDTVITGTGVPGATIDLNEGGVSLACSNAIAPATGVVVAANGSWSCEIAAVETAGDVISAVATEPTKNASVASTATVIDDAMVTQPPTTTASNGSSVGGNCPLPSGMNAAVQIYNGSTLVCTTTANATGDYSCSSVSPVPANGVSLNSICIDPVTGTPSVPGVTLVDANAPAAPSINPVKTTDTVVTGTSEPGARIDLTKNDPVAGTALSCTNNAPSTFVTADAAGNWSCTIAAAESANTVITATATDAAGNTSGNASTAVAGAAASVAPVINTVVSNATMITGLGVPGATIVVSTGVGATPLACTNAPVIVSAAGMWSCNIVAAQAAGTTVNATATEPGKAISGLASTTVANNAVITQQPISNPTDGNPASGSCAVAGAQVQVFNVIQGNTMSCTTITGSTVNASGGFDYSCSPLNPAAANGDVLNAICIDPTTGQPSQPTTVTVDMNAPAAPASAPVTTGSTSVTGTAEPGGIINVSSSNAAALMCNPTPVIADAAGNWVCTLTAGSVVAAGDTITTTVTDAAGNTSAPTTTVVTDAATTSEAPLINTVDDNDTVITGSGVAGATITLSNGSGALACTNAPVVVDAAGNWSCITSAQTAASTISAVAQDADTMKAPSPAASTTVVAATAVTQAPAVSDTNGATVAGTCTATPNAGVSVFNANVLVCTTVADNMGAFSCSPVSPMPSNGAVLNVVCTNPVTGQPGAPTMVAVDMIAPGTPVVNSVGTTSTMMSGTAEPGATITLTSELSPGGSMPLACTPTPVIADAAGNWSCTIAMQAANTVITAVATDVAGNASVGSSTTVTNSAATSAVPSINAVLDTATSVTGSGTPAATVNLTTGAAPGTALMCSNAPVIVTPAGTWTCNLPAALSTGTVLNATAQESGKAVSPVASTMIVDDASPNSPPDVTQPTLGNPVAGSCPVAGSTVKVINITQANAVVCNTVADASGDYSCSTFSPALAMNDSLSVICTDANGQSTPPTIVTVGVMPTKLSFTNVPMTGIVSETLSALVVTLQDSSGATAVSSTDVVTLAINANPSLGVLGGTLSAAAVNGIATFTNVNINMIGNGYTLDATAAGLMLATSSQINIVAEPAAGQDSDGDGLPDSLEIRIGSDPQDPDGPIVGGANDTDGDGITNGIEGYLSSINPAGAMDTLPATDSDMDGVPDATEIRYDTVTMPSNAFDSLPNNGPGQPGGPSAVMGVTNAQFTLLTNLGLMPSSSADFDRDVIPDVREIELGSDPFTANQLDSDGDGINDILELSLVGNPDNTTDTDGDGIPDVIELGLGSDFAAGTGNNFPTANGQLDSEATPDGISDAVEAYILSGHSGETDVTPTSDFDGDGVPDAVEVAAGSSPFAIEQPVVWITAAKGTNPNTIQLQGNLGGFQTAPVTSQWTLPAGLAFDTTAANGGPFDGDEKFTQIDSSAIAEGVYEIKLVMTRTITVNGTDVDFVSDALYYLSIDAAGASIASTDDDGDGVRNPADRQDGTRGKEEVIQVQANNNSSYLATTNDSFILRLGSVARQQRKDAIAITTADLQAAGDNGKPVSNSIDVTDVDFTQVGGIFDYEVAGIREVGSAVQIVLPLLAAIPADAVLRKFSGTKGWSDFSLSGGNKAASAAGSPGNCPASGNAAYSDGLTEGHFCVQLTIVDDGVNDAGIDGSKAGSTGTLVDAGNGLIVDPVAVATSASKGKVKTGLKGGAMTPMMLLLLVMGVLVRLRTRALSVALAIATVFGLSVAAHASGDDSADDLTHRYHDSRNAIRGKWYVGGGVGLSDIDPDTSESSLRVVNDDDRVWRIFAGYDVRDWLGFELSYADLGDSTLTGGSKIDYNVPGLSGILYWPGNDKALSLYAKAGLSALDTTSEDDSVEVEEVNRAQVNIGLGLQWNFTRTWGTRLEWEGVDKDASLVTLNVFTRFGGKKPRPTEKTQPRDSDNDGVMDDSDQCPATPKGDAVDGKGCTIVEVVEKPVPVDPTADSDGDSIVDVDDQCPNTPEGTLVDKVGCKVVLNQADLDNDGVIDVEDFCPNSPVGQEVDRTGCKRPDLPDADEDNVPDVYDRCPSTTLLLELDERGCAAYQVGISEVLFDTNSSVLKSTSFGPLNRVIDALNRYPDIRTEIQAHSDSVGKDSYNLWLSGQRARSVQAYLIDNGIAQERIPYEGYGESKPISSNDTAEGRKRNRRVQFYVYDQKVYYRIAPKKE